jgi:tRNA(fMet)-specific endonuclease VapC
VKVLVDTSVWIEYFKNNQEVTRIIDEGLSNGTFMIAGPIITELLQGVKSSQEKEQILSCIDVNYIDVKIDDWILAGEIANQLRTKGITIPFVDSLLAAIASNNHMKVYTKDKHFNILSKELEFGCLYL